MNTFLILLAFGGGTGSSVMTEAYALLWILIALLVLFFCGLMYYIQRKEIMLTRIFQYNIPLSREQLSFLKKFPYYNLLSNPEKLRFEKRIRHFLVNKKFVAHDMKEVTGEMKLTIAIAWTRLIFRHRPFYLSSFKVIHVYPSHQTNIKEIKKRKQLIISWKEFEQGYDAPHDGYNPGLAALAIALILEDHSRHKEDKLFGGNAAYNWHMTSVPLAQAFTQHVLKYRQLPDKPLDEEDFFALAVVYFFERSNDFQEQFPTLYSALAELLNEYNTSFNSPA